MEVVALLSKPTFQSHPEETELRAATQEFLKDTGTKNQ